MECVCGVWCVECVCGVCVWCVCVWCVCVCGGGGGVCVWVYLVEECVQHTGTEDSSSSKLRHKEVGEVISFTQLQ